VLSKYNIADAEKLLPRRVRIVRNGIPDPCPEFAETVLARRQARFAARAQLLAGGTATASPGETGGNPHIVRVLFLAHCMREKGVFDSMQAVVLANRTLADRKASVRLRLIIAGTFVSQEEKREFDDLMRNPEMSTATDYRGFVSGEGKEQAFREADLFCFPTYYLGENQPVNLIEAMAYGLPVVTTRWRSLPEMLPEGYTGLVAVRSPEQIAAALLELMTRETGEGLRQIFLNQFTIERHLSALAEAIASVEQPSPALARATSPTTA